LTQLAASREGRGIENAECLGLNSHRLSDAMPETGLVRYDAMCRAIDAAYEIDEVKDIHDRAVAIERYQQIAKNVEAEDRCYQIRWRAANKAGELLKAMEKAKASPGNQYTGRVDRSDNATGPKTLAELGISKSRNISRSAGPANEFGLLRKMAEGASASTESQAADKAMERLRNVAEVLRKNLLPCASVVQLFNAKPSGPALRTAARFHANRQAKLAGQPWP
jgi:hypothetical protein